jgi:hypothetical protein
MSKISKFLVKNTGKLSKESLQIRLQIRQDDDLDQLKIHINHHQRANISTFT